MSGINRSWHIVRVAILVTLQLYTPSAIFAAATSVNKTQDFNFGKFVGGAGYSGTVTIDTSGARFSSGSVIRLGTVFSPARFTITGDAGASYSLTLPSEFTIDSGADMMNISAVTSSIPITGVIPAGGALPFVVGGTLTVNSTQKNSTYSGTLMISVK
jgi:hypothetical protein